MAVFQRFITCVKIFIHQYLAIQRDPMSLFRICNLQFKRIQRHIFTLIALLIFSGITQASESTITIDHAINHTIDHAMGKTNISSRPLRIVTLYQGATDTAVALGITPVGIVESWVEKPIYQYLRNPLSSAKIVGMETQPNLEEIAKLQPDLIIASKLRHTKIYKHLSMIAPTIAHDTVFDYRGTLNLISAATQRETEGQKVLQHWEQRIAHFQQQMIEKYPTQWPQKAAIINFRTDHARIYFNGFGGLILNELGFIRPQTHQQDSWGVKLTSKETIPSMNAETLFVFLDKYDPVAKQNYQTWSSHPLWGTLDAVKKQHVFDVDAIDWNMGGGILAANRMLDQLYEHYQLTALSAELTKLSQQ